MDTLAAPLACDDHAGDVAGTRRMARLTGVAYLGLAVCGLAGNVVIRGALYADEPGRTAANLVEREGLARLGIAVDLGIVVAQAVAAWCFCALFRRVHATAAGAIAAFGLAGAAALLVAVGFSSTALEVALARSPASAHDAQLLYDLQGAAWKVGGLFFGLWLVPMGWLVLRSACMPRLLGWLLITGGAGYLLSTYATYLLPVTPAVADALLVPSTIGEVWMIGYLLVKGVAVRRPRPADAAPRAA